MFILNQVINVNGKYLKIGIDLVLTNIRPSGKTSAQSELVFNSYGIFGQKQTKQIVQINQNSN